MYPPPVALSPSSPVTVCLLLSIYLSVCRVFSRFSAFLVRDHTERTQEERKQRGEDSQEKERDEQRID